jgi:hypothetical protein
MRRVIGKTLHAQESQRSAHLDAPGGATHHELRTVGAALCANVLETPSLKEFTVEGGEVLVNGSTG